MASDNTNLDGAQYFTRVFIDDHELPNKSIQSLSIREFVQDTACELDLFFFDNGFCVEQSPIVDGSVVKVILAKDNDEKPLELSFDVLGSKVEKKNSPGNTIYFVELVGITKTENLFGPVAQRAFVGPSNEVIGQIISEEKDITYVEEVKSNDSQTWFQISINNSNFVKNIIRRSYYQDEDMALIYCNSKNVFTFSTLKTKAAKSSKYIAINNDLMSLDSGDYDKVLKDLRIDTKNKNVLFFRTNYTFNDNMPIENRTGGYGYDFTYFDGTNFYDHVINFDYAPLTKYINKKKGHNLNYDSINYNMQNSNVHGKYILAYNQNSYLSRTFFSNFTTITISPNNKIDLMDKIDVQFLKMEDSDSGEVSIDAAHSGEYLVAGIYHNIQQGGIYTMILILARNGYNIVEDPKISKVMLEKGNL